MPNKNILDQITKGQNKLRSLNREKQHFELQLQVIEKGSRISEQRERQRILDCLQQINRDIQAEQVQLDSAVNYSNSQYRN